MTSPAEIDLHEQACSQLDTLYRHLRDGSAPGPTDLVTVLVAQRLLEDRLAGLREGVAPPPLQAPAYTAPGATHACSPDGAKDVDGVYTCPTCALRWRARAGSPSPAEPAAPSPVDRHIARAAKATAPRRGRAPSAKEPCAAGSPRHRFGADGGCKVTGCAVKRATKGTPAPAAESFSGIHRTTAPSLLDRAAATTASPITDDAIKAIVELSKRKPPTKRRTMTVEMPDGSKLHPGETAPLVHHFPVGRQVADCGERVSDNPPAQRTTITTDVTCPACIATA